MTPHTRRRGQATTRPWRTLPTGASFTLPCPPDQRRTYARSLVTSCWRWKQVLGRTFRVNQVPEGVQITRTA